MDDEENALRIPIEIIWDDRDEKRIVRRFEYSTDMTPVAAAAFKRRAEADEKIVIVPARHRTYQIVAGALATVFICWEAFQKLTGADLAKVLIAAIGAIGAVFVVREYKKRKKD